MHPTAIKVTVNGNDITTTINDRLESLQVTDNAGIDSDTIAITLDDRDQAIALPRIDADIEVWFGPIINGTPQLTWAGIYTIDEIETDDHQGTLSIHGKAANMVGGLKAPRDQSYHDITLGQLLTTIAKRHGYTAAIPDTLANKHYPHIDQRTQADIDLLTSKATELDAICKPTGKRLCIIQQDSSQTISGKPLEEIPLNAKTEGVYITAKITGRSHYNSVKAYWQKPDAPTKRSLSIGGKEPQYTMADIYPTHQQASDAIDAKFKQLKRGGTELTIELPFNPKYRAEHTVKLFNHRHAGRYVIKETTHHIGSGNLATTTVTLKEPSKKE
ncbi:Uncharacterised protein [BD1-7 clade bacterium]|uniref:Phage late control D family protein n=1 Tax=BD1-7 clade bacterium TaxID=2029982 RepID=A0A5S9P2X8_9GAMM|nr:Uncharacterised protein [BD1-7 clade bacterium]CAA0122802.1 Uncharacterised protein [BD1-7 clade bacterium]